MCLSALHLFILFNLFSCTCIVCLLCCFMVFDSNKSSIVQVATLSAYTWLVSATVDVLHLVQVSHDRLPLVVDVVKLRRLLRQLPPDVLAEKYVLYTQRKRQKTSHFVHLPSGSLTDWVAPNQGFPQIRRKDSWQTLRHFPFVPGAVRCFQRKVTKHRASTSTRWHFTFGALLS